ncbi:unnamed protein product [Cylindrotheca closterium]|uniref:Uncharacterized protein n=1 Tax=Cylindrotheca closterium TaxID=2856 RepID=A0AAD2CG66_9STRA|nr:unnamed protein product [Cylindrotheca closterium]
MMETDDLMIAESSSSLHLTESSDEEEPAPELSKLSASGSVSDDDESSDKPQSASEDGESTSTTAAEKSQSNDTPISNVGSEPVVSEISKEEEGNEDDDLSSQVESSEDETYDEAAAAAEEVSSETSKNDESSPLEILNSEQQGDGSLYIEVKDDGCGDPEEAPGAKIQRLARKAGIIVGGGTMTAVGTVMLFLPCPTPSIYLMIGGMAIMSKEVPAAQRQLDITRGNLTSWVDRAEKEFSQGGRTINIVVDNGTPKNKEGTEEGKEQDFKEKETPEAITSTQVVHQPRNPVKKHFVKSCRNVILPLLSKVCTPQDEMDQNNAEEAKEEGVPEASPAVEAIPEPKTPSNGHSVEGKENAEPWDGPFARWSKYRETRRLELMKAEEQREREAMLARINEANLKKLQEEFESSGQDVVQEVATDEEEEEEEEDDEGIPAPPALMEVQTNSSVVLRV